MHKVLGYHVIECCGSGRGEYWYCSCHRTMRAAREEIARMQGNTTCHRKLRIKKERCYQDEDRNYYNPSNPYQDPRKMGRIFCFMGEWQPQQRYSSGRRRGERRIDVVRFGEDFYCCASSHTSNMRRKPTRKQARDMWKQMEEPRVIELKVILADTTVNEEGCGVDIESAKTEKLKDN